MLNANSFRETGCRCGTYRPPATMHIHSLKQEVINKKNIRKILFFLNWANIDTVIEYIDFACFWGKFIKISGTGLNCCCQDKIAIMKQKV